MKTAVISALFGDYDAWEDPIIANSEYDYFLFTNQPIESKVYKVVQIDNPHPLEHRRVKILPQAYLPDYECFVWHDANITQVADIKTLVDASVKAADVVFLQHPMNKCTTRELHLCAKLNKDNIATMSRQVHEYILEGFPMNYGAVETGVNIRKNNADTQRFSEIWWQEVSTKSKRDQLSVKYALWKSGVYSQSVGAGVLHNQMFFNLKNHKVLQEWQKKILTKQKYNGN